jgi:FkbM family methyltransferase
VIGELTSTLKFIFNHPLTKHSKWSAFKRFAGWQIQYRIFRRPVVYPFVENSKLVVQGGMTGATGNIYTGLHEFEDMMFLLHVLRPNDIFVDAGSNIGSYSILASAVAGAKSISFEPVPSTFVHLKNNVALNNIEALVELHNAGVGERPGTLRFTSGHDTTNHVITESSDSEEGEIEVDIVTLDNVLDQRTPILIKIDTEGFELSVLSGARSILENTKTLAIIVELNGACQRYGVKENDIHQLIIGFGFVPVSYNPFDRSYVKRDSFNPGANTIYVKNEKEIGERLVSARKFKVLNQCV